MFLQEKKRKDSAGSDDMTIIAAAWLREGVTLHRANK